MSDANAIASGSRPASRNRNLLSVRLDGLLERSSSRTPSPVDPEMLRASAASTSAIAKRSSVTLSRPGSSASLSGRAYHTQPAIDPPASASLPASPSTSSFRNALPATEDGLGLPATMTSTASTSPSDYSDEETRLMRERTARALQEAMETDVTVAYAPPQSSSRSRVPEPRELEGDARLQHPASKPTHSRAQSHSQGVASGSTNARMPSSLLGRPLRTAPLLDLARQTTLASSSVMNLGDYEPPSPAQGQSMGLGLASLPPLPSDPASDDFLRLSPTHGPQYASRPPNSDSSSSGTIKSTSPRLLRQREPTRTTSVDTLRSIQNVAAQRRALHSSSPSEGQGGGGTGALWGSGSTGWWFQHKNDVEPLLDDRDKEDANESAEDKLRKRYTPPKEAVVLAHGLLGFDSVSVATVGISYWRGIREALEAIGCQVLIARVPATSSIEERAKVLESIISKELPGRRVHLIGHSMGGLDSRFLVSRLRSDRFTPVSVTTIASPHRGSTFATTFLKLLGEERLPSFLSFLDLLPNGGGDGKAFESLTPEAMAAFNAATPDAPDVRYFSFGAAYRPGLIDTFKWPHSVIMEAEGPNDGLVSVKSSKWGKYVGTLENVNHMDLVGWVNAARFAWADLTGNSIKFKPATFYLEVVDMLAQDVEGQPGKQGAGTTHDWVEDPDTDAEVSANGDAKAGAGTKPDKKPIEESDQVDTDSKPPPG